MGTTGGFTIKKGDTAPALTQTLKQNGVAVDLTNATSVAFRWKKTDSTAVSSATASIVDAANGIVEYDWKTGDLAAAGGYEGEFAVTWNDGDIQTFPSDSWILITVFDTLD